MDERKALIIGVGNEYRSDDGVGLIAAGRLAEKGISRLDIIATSGEGVALMELWRGIDDVIIIDAIQSGADPGTIKRFDAVVEKIPVKYFSHSTHRFGLAEAIEMARQLKLFPKRLIIYGIEGGNFDFGVELSDKVKAALDRTVDVILTEIQSWSTAEALGSQPL
jgi:hydrogenase maturation protease